MMSENEEILKVIEKQREFLNSSRYDVFQSVKGVWLFIEFDEKRNEFYTVVSFTTAKELEFLIASSIADDISCSIDMVIEDATLNFTEVNVENTVSLDDYKLMLPKLDIDIRGLQRVMESCVSVLGSLYKDLNSLLID